MNKKLILAAAAIVFSTLESSSQENTSALDPVSVTATMHPRKSSATGRDLIVIKGEVFSKLPVHSVDELLRYLPGVEVQARGPMGAQADIVIRGGTFQQVLVILDGMRLNDPNTGHFTAYIPIAPFEIERIEILKGASSAMYGSEAVGGVIQIITKSFASSKEKEKASLSAGITGGQFGSFSVDAGGFYAGKGTALSAGLLSNNTTGPMQRGTHGSVYAHTGSVSFSHYFNEKLQVFGHSSLDSRHFSAQNFYTTFLSDTATEKVETFWNQVGLRLHGKRNNMSVQGGYKNVKDAYQYNPSSIANSNRSRLFQALFTDELYLSDHASLVQGLQFVNRSIRSNDRGNHDLSMMAAFLTGDINFARHWTTAPALRLEWHEVYGWQLVPQVNISFRPGKFQLRASAGKTLRDADFTERYNNFQKAFVSGGSIGNPSLKAERSFSYEAGADLFMKDVKWSATYFSRRQKDLIDYVPTAYSDMPRKDNLSPTGSYALAMNIAEVNTSGVETALQLFKKMDAGQRLEATAGASWTWSESSAGKPSFYLSSHARFMGNMNVRYAARLWGLSATAMYKERNPRAAPAGMVAVDAHYFVMNAKAETYLYHQRVSVFAECDNIFNETYADLLGAIMPGRWLMGGVRLTLNK